MLCLFSAVVVIRDIIFFSTLVIMPFICLMLFVLFAYQQRVAFVTVWRASFNNFRFCVRLCAAAVALIQNAKSLYPIFCGCPSGERWG